MTSIRLIYSREKGKVVDLSTDAMVETVSESESLELTIAIANLVVR